MHGVGGLLPRRRARTRHSPNSGLRFSGGSASCAHRQVDLDAKEAQLFDAHAQHSWFTSDHRLGQLCITMEPNVCFMAEDYAQVRGRQGHRHYDS